MSPGVTQAPPRSCTSSGLAAGRAASSPSHSMRGPRVRSAPFAIGGAAASQVARWALRQSFSGCCKGCDLTRRSEKRQVQSVLACALDGTLVAGIGMPHHPARGIVPEDTLDAARGCRRSVADDDEARVLRVTHADATAVMDRYPGGAACRVEERVQQWPVGDRIGAIAHGLGLAVGTCDRARVEMIAADDDRRLELTASHHLVERESEAVPVTEPHPADTRRQALELDALARHVEPMMQ